MGKAKLITSSAGTNNNPEGKWYKLEEIRPFIQGIVTGDLDIDQVSSTLISGVPTPWARAKLFLFSFDYLEQTEANIQTSGLISFYEMLRDEWKGLIALVALYPDRISFSEPVKLNVKDENLYEISGALGRMLFDDEDIWTDQIAKQSNPDELPFIQLIYYKGQIIGATSPFSIVFPGVDYRGLKYADDIPWFRSGKFEDPMRSLSSDRDKLQKLYLFLNNINSNFSEFKQTINLFRSDNNLLDLSGLIAYIRRWLLDVESIGKNLKRNGTVAKYYNLSMPFKALLASVQKVWQLNTGEFTFIKPTQENLIRTELSDLQNILKEDKKIIGWFETSDRNPLSRAAVYYLKVHDVRDTENPIKYFALPLSLEAIQIFTQRLGSLVSHTNQNFDITGKINDQGILIVDVTVPIDGQPYRLNSKEYEIEWAPINNKVIMWPDFISDNWDAYYLYSEFPLNVQGIKFVPFFKKGLEQKIITINRNVGGSINETVVYSNSEEADLKEGEIDITNLVTYPAGRVSPDKHKYEVIKSNRPIAGLEIRIENAGQSQIAGYLIVKNPDDDTMGSKKISNLTSENINRDAIVGIDFGSNNSCVHYTLRSAGNNGATPINFQNRRLSLVGIDPDNNSIAERDELLFFSNEPTTNGQIKSWLHEHDARYIGAHHDKEISGGVAVNERNILVNKMDRETITTQAGILNYNMKWLSGPDGLSKKTAYLKALWLSICADLYAQKIRPVELRWSFPGSMSPTDIIQYRAIYKEQLPQLTPIKDGNDKTRLKPTLISDQTEAESVCKFALSRNISLDNNMFIGIDVGGSTSDILLLAKDINANNAPRLYKQSSIRIAAGVFFDAITRSPKFRKAIFNYHQGQKKIKVENIQEILLEGQKAPFYLSSVFDQLTAEDFGKFYSYIGKEAPFVLAIPAYVTGLIIFYAGKLCAKTLKENNLTKTITEIHLLPFGKGGRLFHWLETMPGKELTDEYYDECFRKGFGTGAESIKLVYRDDFRDDNKSEVSKGLAVDSSLIYDKNVRFNSDIFAEKNIQYLQNGQYITFEENEVVSDAYFETVEQFKFPQILENFETFLRIFIDFAGHKSGFLSNIKDLEDNSSKLASLLSNFIKNDSEWIKADETRKLTRRFEYRFPILIAEGLCYLEQILIPEVFKS